MGILDKASDALAAFRGEATFNPLGLYEPGAKGVSFSGYGEQGYVIDDQFTHAALQGLARFAGTKINYRREVGDLTGSSLIMAAVNWQSRTSPEAELQVVALDKQGKVGEVLYDHPLVQLIRRPNQFYSYSDFLSSLAVSWIPDGNPYFIKVRNGLGEPIELWYAPPFMMRPVWPVDGSRFLSGYEYRAGSYLTTYEIDPETGESDVLHLKFMPDPATQGRTGISPVASVLREVYADNEASNYQALLMKNSGVPPFILSPKAGVTLAGVSEPDKQRLKEEFDKRRTGDNRGKSMFSWLGLDIQKMALSAKEMDLRDNRRLPEERIAAVVGIPAIVLGFGAGLERSTFSNTEQAQEYAYESYLIPELRKIAEQLEQKLLPDFHRGKTPANYRVRFDTSMMRALQEDEDNKMKRAVIGYKGGIVTLDEARADIGKPPLEGDKGKAFYQPAPSPFAPSQPDANPIEPGKGKSVEKEAGAG